jgi:DNA-binding response OmpR family regulator
VTRDVAGDAVTRDVLLVTDDRDEELLLRAGIDADPRWRVVGVAATLEAVRAALKRAPDVAVVDLRWPPAVDVAMALRYSGEGDAPTIVLRTGRSGNDVSVVARLTGAVGVLHDDVAARNLGRELARLTDMVGAAASVLHRALTLPADVTTPAAARSAVSAALAEWSMDELTDAVVLLVSELVTNAVIHARTEVDVVVYSLADCIRVEVSDQSPELPLRRPPDWTREGGHGIEIVALQATDWGVAARAGGKTVWFELARSLASG